MILYPHYFISLLLLQHNSSKDLYLFSHTLLPLSLEPTPPKLFIKVTNNLHTAKSFLLFGQQQYLTQVVSFFFPIHDSSFHFQDTITSWPWFSFHLASLSLFSVLCWFLLFLTLVRPTLPTSTSGCSLFDYSAPSFSQSTYHLKHSNLLTNSVFIYYNKNWPRG